MNRFKEARMNCGIAQKTVANRLGVSIQSVSNWENNSRSPSRENVVKMAEMYGVSIDYLLNKDCEETQQPVEIKKVPVVSNEALDDELVQYIMELNPEERQIVRGFVAGVRARRVVPASQNQ